MKFIIYNLKYKIKALPAGKGLGGATIGMVAVLAMLLTAFATPLSAQVCAPTSSVMAKWDFNAKIEGCGNPTYEYSGYKLLNYATTFCPAQDAFCGVALLGADGHFNTDNFTNALCLHNFYWTEKTAKTGDCGSISNCNGFDPASTVFNPKNPANIRITYDLPVGKIGTLDGVSLRIVGAYASFEKQGVGVYRNGVLIYSSTQPTAPSLTFTFPSTPEFASDGTTEVKFKIVYSLVHQLVDQTKAVYMVGYDDMCVLGTCGIPRLNASTTPSSCSGPNGKIKLTGFNATDKADYTIGSTYTGTATYASGSTAIPADGVITSTLPNPSSSQDYTVRVFTATCYIDKVVTLKPTWCPNPPAACVTPTGAVLTAVQSTCSAANIANSDAQVQVTGVTVGDRVDISPGTTYTGGLYATATALVSGAYTFTGLPNPTGTQDYTVRVFNGTDDCIKDYTVTLSEKSCGPCKTANFHVYSNQVIDSPTTNNYAPLTVCTGTQKINLNLTKTVAPNTGTTCPTNTPFVWTITINNTGDMAATDIQVSDLLPSGLVYVSSIPSVGTFGLRGGWAISTLAAGGSATLTITTKALTAGTFTNIAEIMTALPLNDPNSTPGNGVTTEDDYATASITVTGPNPPKITKEFSPMFTKPNTPTRLTIKITNNEATPVTLSADFIDNLPSTPAQMVIAATPNLQTTLTGVIATAAGTSITIPKGTTLLPGLNQLSVEITVPSDGLYCNQIAAGVLKTSSCDNIEAVEGCVMASSTFVMAPLIKKTMLPATIQAGQNAALTLSVENRNAVTMTLSQDFIDYFPTGLVMAGTPTSSCASLTVTAQNSNKELKIASGGSIPANTICTITVPVTSSTAGNYCNVIVMNGFLTTVGTTTDVGNQDVAEACVKVVANPCTAIDVTAITPSPVSPFVTGTAVTLTPTITGAGSMTTYQWSVTPNTGNPYLYFNNAGFVTPTWTPTVAGNYTLKLVVNNSITGYGVCKDSLSINVVVTVPAGPCTPITAATATATPNSIATGASAALSVTATAAGTPVYSYAWAGTGGFSNTTQNPSTGTLTTAGGYSYTVTVTNTDGTGTCTITATTSLTVSTAAATCTPPTGVSATASPSTVVAGGSVNLSSAATGATNWAWSSSAGSPSFTSTVQSPGSVVFPTAGTYTFTVTASHSANATCTASATASVSVSTAAATCTPPTGVSITITPSTIATGGSINLASASTGATNWAWSGGSAGSPFTSTLQNPGASTAPASAGTYTYTVTASHSANATCTASATATLSVSAVSTCTTPSYSAESITATCNGSTANSNGTLKLNNVSNGDKAGYSTGATYTGSAYSAASTIPANGILVSNLANPASATQYTIRVFNGGDACFYDQTITLLPKTCPEPATCLNKPNFTVAGVQATCSNGSALGNAKIVMSGLTLGDKVGYSVGTTFSGSYATAVAIPADGVVASGLANPATVTQYVVRVYNGATDCYSEHVLTLQPKVCVVNPLCTVEPVFTASAKSSTCNGTTPNNDGSLSISGISTADKVGYSIGATYTGPAYATATAIVGTSMTLLSNIANPASPVTYTVRVFNGSANCYLDQSVTINPSCTNVVAACTMNVTMTQSACNNNGTPTTIPKAIADDYFNVTITATNGASTGTYQVVLAGNVVGSGTYGTSTVVSGAAGLLKADGTSTYTITIRDQSDNTCSTTKTTTVVANCSTACPPQLCPIVTTQKN
jgi:uncharacterized repeat protein (TIGR01451 family)